MLSPPSGKASQGSTFSKTGPSTQTQSRKRTATRMELRLTLPAYHLE